MSYSRRIEHTSVVLVVDTNIALSDNDIKPYNKNYIADIKLSRADELTVYAGSVSAVLVNNRP